MVILKTILVGGGLELSLLWIIGMAMRPLDTLLIYSISTIYGSTHDPWTTYKCTTISQDLQLSLFYYIDYLNSGHDNSKTPLSVS